MPSSDANPAAALRRICDGMRAAQALHAAAKLALADRLADGPASGAELAAFAGCETSAVRRLARALCALGVFAEPESDRFALTPLGQALCSGAPGSFRAGALFLVGEARWRCWADLLGSLRTGEPRPPSRLGASLFDWYAANPAESAVHDAAMTAFTSAVAGPLVEAAGLARSARSSTSAAAAACCSPQSSPPTPRRAACCSTCRTSSRAPKICWPGKASPSAAASSRAISSSRSRRAAISICSST